MGGNQVMGLSNSATEDNAGLVMTTFCRDKKLCQLKFTFQ
jgi:hypothetical protein